MHDLSEGEDILGIPAIPIWEESSLKGNALVANGGATVLAAFHPPCCDCGRQYGIAYDRAAVALNRTYSMNQVLLHELVHAWQYWLDPDNAPAVQRAELEQFGYKNAPHEVEARVLARWLDNVGIRVWFPACE